MKTDELRIEELKIKTRELRELIVKTGHEADGAHYGGSLSMAEILVVLYNAVMKIDPKNPKWDGRDYFILSKGHGCAGLAPLLSQLGFFDKGLLANFNKLGSFLGMHTSLKTPGVEHPTGSLGHGLSVGVGVALALRMDGKPNRVFVLLGDGEVQEGSVWEAAMAANKWHLDNLVCIIDSNGFVCDGRTEEQMPIEPIDKRWSSFGWSVKIVNGHEIGDLLGTLSHIPFEKGLPSLMVARTVKGKGISFMENKYQWHYGHMSKDQYEKAMTELKKE